MTQKTTPSSKLLHNFVAFLLKSTQSKEYGKEGVPEILEMRKGHAFSGTSLSQGL
jgi:hypothetical protein